MRRPLLVAAAVVAIGALSASAQQRPGPPPRDNAAAAARGTARIRGKVVGADTSAPLRRAQVTITSAELGVRRATTTDADGRYEFVELPAGRYVIGAGKGGYVTLQYGQRRPLEAGRPLAVVDDQILADVDFVLPRGSVITGRIVDEFGEPVTGAQIQVQRYQYGPGGQRRLGFAGGFGFTQTDDRGEFRVFGLMPGEYVISAVMRSIMISVGSANPNDASDGFLPTYYPGTASPAEAENVSVGVGQELSLQFALLPSRMARITGTVVDSQGRAVTTGFVTLRTVSENAAMTMSGGQLGADGGFTLTVPPGNHFIDVRPGPRAPGAEPEFASVPVTVGTEDIRGLRITTGPGALIAGRVIFEGTAERTGGPTALRINAMPPDGRQSFFLPGDPAANGLVAEDGTFLIRGVTGPTIFRPITPPAWTLKSVTLDGADITDTPIDAAGDIDDVRIVLTDRLTDVSGSVKDDRGRPVADYVVVVVPEEAREGMAATRHTRTGRPDQSGVFRVRGLPPGRYAAIAVEGIEGGGEWDPQFQTRARTSGRAFTLTEGQAVALDLALSQ
jgi:protocatechuate 3,4-dioxygenase beta subunit